MLGECKDPIGEMEMEMEIEVPKREGDGSARDPSAQASARPRIDGPATYGAAPEPVDRCAAADVVARLRACATALRYAPAGVLAMVVAYVRPVERIVVCTSDQMFVSSALGDGYGPAPDPAPDPAIGPAVGAAVGAAIGPSAAADVKWTSIGCPMGSYNGWACVAIANSVYVTGSAADRGVRRAAHRYDVRTNRWDRLPDLKAPRAAHAMVALGTRIYAIGGTDGARSTRSCESLDATATCGGWTGAPSMAVGRVHPHAAAVGGSRPYVIVCGGDGR